MVLDMSRGPVRTASEICGDCSATEPKWASVNRGVLICDECCSIHRSLGRHISQVKSLKKGSWASSLLACVHQLVSSGANSIWEHTLVDPTLNKQCRKKPIPRDPLHPTKADFIRAKYQFLTFTKKYKDEDMGTVTDLSKQLHSSVRTNNLETSLRLLSLGADPNYLHPERGNRALHVAAQSGQGMQVELLIVYGADPGSADNVGKTPADYTGEGSDIAHRLIECQYELTDTLAYYLCQRKPDHRSGQHFIIPEMADSVDVTELAKAARKKLQALPHHLFEELAMDVYDEVDRRENDSIWISTKSVNTSDRQAVPFLPVNPDFSSTRNQGRQKLARFNAREFATLIIDLLSDAKRRQLGVLNPPSNDVTSTATIKPGGLKNHMRNVKTNSFSDDEPAYDTVASDEDYSSIGDRASIKESTIAAIAEHPAEQSLQSGDSTNGIKSPRSPPPASSAAVKDFTDSPPAPSNQNVGQNVGQNMGGVPVSESQCQDEVELRMALAQSQNKVSEMVSLQALMQREINKLKDTVKHLMTENASLKSSKAQPTIEEVRVKTTPKAAIPAPSSLTNGASSRHHLQFRSTATFRNRPHSMVETSKSRLTAIPIDISSNLQTSQSGSLSNLLSSKQPQNKTGDVMTDSNNDNDSLYDNEDTAVSSFPDISRNFPSQESIDAKTENITKKIQELLLSARENKHESYGPCSDKITVAVDSMINLFPVRLDDTSIQAALSKLKSEAMKLCQEAKSQKVDASGQVDLKLKTQLIYQCAYDIAKAAKVLVTSIQKATGGTS